MMNLQHKKMERSTSKSDIWPKFSVATLNPFPLFTNFLTQKISSGRRILHAGIISFLFSFLLRFNQLGDAIAHNAHGAHEH